MNLISWIIVIIITIMLLGEAYFQNRPIWIYKKPIASRRSYMFGIIKYLMLMSVNYIPGVSIAPIILQILGIVGLLKDCIAFYKLRELKEGSSI